MERPDATHATKNMPQSLQDASHSITVAPQLWQLLRRVAGSEMLYFEKIERASSPILLDLCLGKEANDFSLMNAFEHCAKHFA